MDVWASKNIFDPKSTKFALVIVLNISKNISNKESITYGVGLNHEISNFEKLSKFKNLYLGFLMIIRRTAEMYNNRSQLIVEYYIQNKKLQKEYESV